VVGLEAAIDQGGQESETPQRIVMDPEVVAPSMEVNCTVGDCEQPVCGEE
jgi:hypothetical protein